jgi:hypothetical protein
MAGGRWQVAVTENGGVADGRWQMAVAVADGRWKMADGRGIYLAFYKTVL